MTRIAIANRSTVVADDEVEEAVAALQKQVDDDLDRVWGLRADLTFVPTGSSAPEDAWLLGVFDSSDHANVLGYHDITAAGLPLGKVFAKTDIDSGSAWTVTLSHELIEMLGDPEINLAAQAGSRFWAFELCDPCEADAFGYAIGNVRVSDFVTPEWFSPTTGLNGPFDLRNRITKPLGVLSGCYALYLEIGSGAGWQQANADQAISATRARVGTRRERRQVVRENWVKSANRGTPLAFEAPRGRALRRAPPNRPAGR